jgi:uncharacterized protein YkwD
LRFNHFFPAVALAVTTSSAIPALAHAAPPPKAAPHSASWRTAYVTKVRHAKTAVPTLAHGAATRETGPAAGVTGAKKHSGTGKVSPVRSSIRLAAKMLVDALNAVRAAKALPPLSLDRRLSKCSRVHSKHMALNGQISHDQFPTDVCEPYRYAAENVGFDPGSPTSAVLALHNLMMREGPCSPNDCTGAVYEQHAHYMNILNPVYRHVGIGIVVKRGATWLTEDFTS